MVCEALQREPLSGSASDLAMLTEFCSRHADDFNADERTVSCAYFYLCACLCAEILLFIVFVFHRGCFSFYFLQHIIMTI